MKRIVTGIATRMPPAQKRVKYWISQGAQPTDTVRGLLKKIEA